MYEGITESLPFNLNVLSIAYGQTFNIEAYIRRIETIKDQATKVNLRKIYDIFRLSL